MVADGRTSNLVNEHTTCLRLIGYWKASLEDPWPEPGDLVDSDWEEEEREDVAEYLKRGMVAGRCMGHSRCRLCGKPNGSLELTDGVYVWPEGLAHYIESHQVRLPSEFVEHVRQITGMLEEATVDASWWKKFA